ncbi:MAG: site-specific DNA-methyltransferase [Thermoplasmata archaeon]|nr:site-specific DNA-methyltransferase [Thermoplasmata archaeon]
MRPGSVRILEGDARTLTEIGSSSVHLVVTSPPYPMVPMWDEGFRQLGATDYEAMHGVLESVWRECQRVLVPGGLAAIVVGDALRRGPNGFRLWPNHAEILRRAEGVGFVPLPYLLWPKPTNRVNAFLGSGFLPPNAYVTLDCEYILLLRNGPLRAFPPGDPGRRRSTYTKAERDQWFSQIWRGVRPARQGTADGRRSGAFPPELPRRLVRMFSVEGETVLDPFAGTGTTLAVARELGRDAIGVEIDGIRVARLRERFSSSARSRGGGSRSGARAPR